MSKILMELKSEFDDRTPMERICILFEYTDYVNSYPEEHNMEGYPACFWEWYGNDFSGLRKSRVV